MADAKQEINNGTSQSRVVLAKPRLGAFGSSGFASSSSKGCNPFGSVLRPPQLKPGNNPFLKISENTEAKPEADKAENIEKEDRLTEAKDSTEAPKFVPLSSANVTPRSGNQVPAPPQAPAAGSAGFVFGQNLSERVMMAESVNNGEANSVDHSSSNGASELLFTSAAASVKDNNQESNSNDMTTVESLAQAAAEYERSHARPPPPTATHTTTGEEGENNVLQMSCRLFAWESGSWRERGRGVLRLNDGAGASRLVARVAGSLRVALNTPLWPDMVAERAGTKSLRITAVDAQQQVKLFLIMGAPGDIGMLYRALTSRLAVTKRTTPQKQNTLSQNAAERLEASVDVDEFLDKPDTASEDDKDTPNDTENDRIDDVPQKTDAESSADDQPEDIEPKAVKRKEPADDETSPKRQCPEVLTE